ncbi:hypothetical protein C8Q72DRAFT_191628 [Fomitopsis betulina]|nr:hypothetical protein C8Q72DRAFT_191628 [Fomitopsis betulina]
MAPIMSEKSEEAAEAVKNEATTNGSIDVATFVNLEVKIVPKEADEHFGLPMGGAIHLGTTLSEFETIDDISSEGPELAPQADSRLDELTTAFKDGGSPGMSSDMEIISVASSEDSPKTTDVFIQTTIRPPSTGDSTQGSDEACDGDLLPEHLNHCTPAEPEPFVDALPLMVAHMAGLLVPPVHFTPTVQAGALRAHFLSFTYPRPTLSRPVSPSSPARPRAMGTPDASRTFTDRAATSSRRIPSYFGNTRLGTITAKGPTPITQPPQTTGPLRRELPGLSWHCRSCGKDPCDTPTATMCGHIFCHQCILREISETMQCPVCRNMFLLKLQVD